MRSLVVLATGIIDHAFVATRATACTRVNPNMGCNTFSTKIITAIRRQQAHEGTGVRAVWDYVSLSNAMLAGITVMSDNHCLSRTYSGSPRTSSVK